MNQQHIATAKQLIRQKGRCNNINCAVCPFQSREGCCGLNGLNDDHNHNDKIAVKEAKMFLDHNNQKIKQPKFQTYQDSKNQWRWRLIAANGKIVAQGESHPTKSAVLRAVRTVKRIVKEI